MSDDRKEFQTQRILDTLAAGPLSALQLRDKLHMSPAQMGRYLSRLTASPRLIRAADYERKGGGKTALYGLGSAPDAVFIRKENMTKTTRLENQLARVRHALAKPRTNAELQSMLHKSKGAVQVCLRTLRDAEPKQVYIESWRETETTIMYSVPVYALGDKPDAQNPKLHAKRKWADLKADVDRHEVYKARKRIKANVKVIAKKPQNIFSALGL